MDRLTDGTGIIGFRLGTVGGPADPFAPIDVQTFETYRIWKHAAERDYVIWMYPRAQDAHLVAYLVDAFPQVRVVLNHLGVCPGEGNFSWDKLGRPHVDIPGYNPAFHTTHRLSKYENVALKLSGQYAFSKESFPYKDIGGWHQGLLRNFGSKRLMWATDFPWILEDPGYGPYTTIIEQSIPDITPYELEDIMGRTAQQFLRFPILDDQD
jgi:predicted TIM-barrel fold metal-dependent hydrolase